MDWGEVGDVVKRQLAYLGTENDAVLLKTLDAWWKGLDLQAKMSVHTFVEKASYHFKDPL